jgi:hypothetical protein
MHDATDFWLVAGTSAPVIALANVVLFGDTFERILSFRAVRGEVKASDSEKRWAKRGLRIGYFTAALSAGNLTAQLLVLVFALDFFTGGISLFSATTVKLIFSYGVSVLLGGSMGSGFVHHAANEMQAASPKQPSTPPSTDA